MCHANEANKSGTEEEGEGGGQARMYVITSVGVLYIHLKLSP